MRRGKEGKGEKEGEGKGEGEKGALQKCSRGQKSKHGTKLETANLVSQLLVCALEDHECGHRQGW